LVTLVTLLTCRQNKNYSVGKKKLVCEFWTKINDGISVACYSVTRKENKLSSILVLVVVVLVVLVVVDAKHGIETLNCRG